MSATASPAWPAPPPVPAMPDVKINPFVGPRALATGEPIHGRAREIAEIRGLLIAHRIVLLYSPSGAGKTSLIEAGLRPEMEQRDFHVLPTIRVGHEVSRAAGGVETNRYCTSVISSLEERLEPGAQLTPEQLASTDLEQYLAELGASDPEQEWCLFFDQFEELFTMNPADVDAKVVFLEQLGAALKNRSFWALIAMREDFIAHLDPHVDTLPTRLRTRFRLGLLSPDAAKEAAQAPAAATGVEFAEAAVDKLVDDLRQIQVQHIDGPSMELGPHVEPLQLQVVCRRLWSASRTSIEVGDLERLGGVDQALADYYVDALEKAVDETSVSETAIRDWFDSDLITDDGYRKPVRRGPGNAGAEVLKQLDEAYLIRRDRRNGTDWYELTHDRVVKPIQESNREFRARRTARRRNIIAVLAIVLAVVGVIALISLTRDDPRELTATDVEELPFDDDVELGAGGFERFLLSPGTGEVIEVSLSSFDLSSPSAQLRILSIEEGETGIELASDSLRFLEADVDKDTPPGAGEADEYLEAASAAVVRHTAAGAGTSLIVEASSQSGGTFRLTIERVVEEPEDQTAVLVPDASAVAGSIDAAGDLAEIPIRDAAGDFRLQVSPSQQDDDGLDSIVRMLDADGSEIAYEDGRGPGQPEIVRVDLDPDDEYTIEVSGYEGSTGDFGVSLRAIAFTSLVPDEEPTEGSLAAADDVEAYIVSDVEGDVLLGVSPSDGTDTGIDVFVTLRDADGIDLASEDSGANGETELVFAALTADSEYTIEVSGYGGSTGAFRVWLTTVESSPLELDAAPVPGVLAADDIALYALRVGADIEVGTIAVVPDVDVDVALDLVTPFGSQTFDDDGAGAGELIDMQEFDLGTLPEDRRWLIAVYTPDGSPGAFEVFATTAD